MALQKQNISIPFNKGIDTKTDDKQVVPGKLLTLENGVFQSLGRIKKRNGYVAFNQSIEGSASILIAGGPVTYTAALATFILFNGAAVRITVGGTIPNSANPTLNINSTGAIILADQSGINLGAGAFSVPGAHYTVTYSSSLNKWIVSPPLPATISQATALANFKNELTLFTDTEMFSFSESTEKWSDKGRVSSLSLTSTSIIRNTYQQTVCDAAFHPSGVEVFTWEDSRGAARYSVVDSITGENILADQLIEAGAEKPKPFALGNYLVILFYNSSSHHLRLLPISVVTPSTSLTIIDVALNVNISNPNYDACLSSSRLYFAYNTSTGGGSITLKYINTFLSASAPRTVAGEVASSCIALTVDLTSTQIWTAYHDGTDVKYFIYDQFLSPTPILAPTIIEANANTINNITLLASIGAGHIYYTQNAAATYNNFIISAHLTNLGVVSGLGVLLRSVGIAAKPFIFNGTIYLTVAFSSILQPTYFVINTSDSSIVAKFSPNVGGGLLAKNIVPEVSQVANGQYLIPALQKDLLTTISGAVYTQTGVNAVIIDFLATGALDKVQLAENLHITGGILYVYDGISVVEHSYHVFPEGVTIGTATGSGSILAGTYQYSVVYEWTDAQGQIQYSAPSVPITQVTTTSSSTNTLTIPTLRLTAKQAPRGAVVIGVYRTEDSGTIFYKVSSITSPLLNDPTVDTVIFTDTMSDTTLVGNQLLYTTGGILENISAPAATFVTTYKDRVILLPSENRNQWWYSKQSPQGVPVEFSDALVNNVDQAGGKLIAAARLDSVLVLMKQTLLYYVTGTGPDSTGAQNDFSDPQPIACDGGCIDKNSVVLTPAGLMYKSQKGIYLLNRQLSVSYIGADVEAFNSFSISSANLLENTQQVRFCLDNGTALVYDYYVKEWSIFTNLDAVDSVLFQGQFTYVRPTGRVLQETPGVFRDDGEFIKLRLVTSWLSLAALQAFQRVYKLLLIGEYISPHNLKVQVAYDFNPFATQESVVLAGALLQSLPYGSDATYGESSPYGGNFPLYQFRVNLSRQKCEAIQFIIEDTQLGDKYGENLALSAFALEVGVKKGLDKIGAKNSVG